MNIPRSFNVAFVKNMCSILIAFIFALCFIFIMTSKHIVIFNSISGKSRLKRLSIQCAAIPMWIYIAYMLIDDLSMKHIFVIVLVTLYMIYDIKALPVYEGDIENMEDEDLLLERSTQVSAVAFAVGTLLFSQKKSKKTTPLVFAALFFCAFSAIPSSTSRKHISRDAILDSIQKSFVTVGAGLLLISLTNFIVY